MAEDARDPLLEREKKEKQKPSTLMTVCPYILGNELCERLAYYGLATNLVTYIGQNIGGDPAFAAILVAVFEGLCYTTPILGAILADSRWGRYKTIKIFSSIYLVGIFMLSLSSYPPLKMIPAADEDPNWLTYVALCSSLCIIALGTGGIKPNVAAFGADQFDENDAQDRKEKDSFFNWFYLAINIGSFIACTAIVYIQDQWSWTLGFAIPGVVMFLAIVLFVMGSKKYKHVRPTESPMTRVAKVVYAALHNRYLKKKSPGLRVTKHTETGSLHAGNLYLHHHLRDSEAGQQQAVPLLAIQSPTYNARLQVPQAPSMSYQWLEDAVTEWQTIQGETMHISGLAGYSPQQVEEVKMVLGLLPVFGATVLYWTIYTQMSSMFVQQGNVMDRSMIWFDGSTVRLPAASMSIFNTVSIIVLIYLYDKFFEPAMRRCYKITLLRRIGWGMVVGSVAMLAAAGVEWWRLKEYFDLFPCPPGCPGAVVPEGGLVGHLFTSLLALAGFSPGRSSAGEETHPRDDCSLCGGPRESPLSIWWQAPQYVLVGMSEVLTSIGLMEFFYDQAPDVMRSCSMALGLLSTALGSYLAGALTWLVQVGSQKIAGQQWLPRDLNKGRLDLFFLFMTVLLLVNTLIFTYIAVHYEYKKVQHRAKPKSFGKMPKRPHLPTPHQEPLMHAQLQQLDQVPTAAMAIAGRAPYWENEEDEEEGPPSDIYGRSLAWIAPSPALPAPYR